MRGLHPQHLLEEVIAPTLQWIEMDSDAARILLLGTAAAESQLRYLRQIGGPALGIYQIEPATHRDVWDNWLAYREPVRARVRALASSRHFDEAPERELVVNLAYATAIARIIYRRAPEALPPDNDLEAQARYWKRWYNTALGAGSEGHYMRQASRVIHAAS